MANDWAPVEAENVYTHDEATGKACPVSMNVPSGQFRSCHGSRCMAWVRVEMRDENGVRFRRGRCGMIAQ